MRASLPLPVQCKAAGLPIPEAEYRFSPPRRWRFDFCWPGHGIALEVQGGIFVQGRHSRGAAMLKEFEKMNQAATLGYRVLYCTPKQVNNGEALMVIAHALRHGTTDLRRSSRGDVLGPRVRDDRSYDEKQAPKQAL